MYDLLIIALIAFVTSIMSGMLGLGGAVLLIPAYLYLPSLFGIETIGVKMVSGMTSVQVFSASLMGLLLHQRKGTVNYEIVLKMGIPILLAAFLGAMYSSFVSNEVIIGVFAFMAMFGAVLMIFKKNNLPLNTEGKLEFNTPLAIFIAIFVGFFGGIAGAPGAFILGPLMMTFLKIPTRITIASTLGIVLLSAGSASAGKLLTGQVPILLTITAVIASIPGVYLGSVFSYRLNVRTLRIILAILISAVGFEMLYQVFIK